MRVILEKINSVNLEQKKFGAHAEMEPHQKEDHFSPEFQTWVSNLIDTLNTNLTKLQTEVNQVIAPSYTTAEITTLAASSPNGTLWYDTTTNELKAKVNNVVVVL